jgi:xylulokinase
MMEKDLVIGVDASTTGCKAIVWDLKGAPVAQGRGSIPMLRPRSGWHEQNADDWWASLAKSLRIATREIDSKRLAGLCICPQRETFVPVDQAGVPVRNAILWMDVRARSLMPAFEREIGRQRFHQITGKPLSGNLTVLKIKWLREFEPDIFVKTSKFVDVAAYLNHRLTGKWGTAWGIAGPTGLFDMHKKRWSDEILSFLGLNQSNLPPSYPTGDVLGTVSDSAARDCGLPPGLPVIAGLGDGQAGGLGLVITRPGECYLSLGTSVVSGTYSERFIADPAFRTMFAGVPGGYSMETVILGGTYTVDWLIDHFCGGLSLEQLGVQIRDLPPGSEGLVLVPYWNSALNPYWDPKASGIVIGWRGHHKPAHLYRAILEGIAFELRLHFEGIRSALGQDIHRLVVMGGGSRNDTWCQIISDVNGMILQRTCTREATALGAGIIAAYGAGIFEDFRSAAANMSGEIQDSFSPDPDVHRQYSQLYQNVYKGLYPAIQPLSGRLAEITSGIG